MNLVAVPCNICGASIDVAETTRFVTCENCHCQLAVVRTEGSVFTELKSNLGGSDFAAAVAAFEDEIDRIEREWQSERDQLTVFSMKGEMDDDSRSATKLYCLLTALLCLPAAIVLLFFDWRFAAGSALIGACAIQYYFRVGSIEKDYRSAEMRYQQRRAAIRLEDFLRAPKYSHSS